MHIYELVKKFPKQLYNLNFKTLATKKSQRPFWWIICRIGPKVIGVYDGRHVNMVLCTYIYIRMYVRTYVDINIRRHMGFSFSSSKIKIPVPVPSKYSCVKYVPQMSRNTYNYTIDR